MRKGISLKFPLIFRTIDAVSVGWFAGFYEGEGTCGQNGRRFHIQIRQVNIEPLENCRILFGGAVTDASHSATHSREMWLWSLSGYKAVDLMTAIYPLLSERRQMQIRPKLWIANPRRPKI